MRLAAVPVLIVIAAALSGCSRSNNLLLGHVEATVGTHDVFVTDCYRFSVPAPEKLGNGSYRFTPCRDADVLVQGDRLIVNGTDYGRLNSTDGILVDHGRVSIQRN